MILGYICAKIVALTIAEHFEKKVDTRESKNEWKRPQNDPTCEFPSPKGKATQLWEDLKLKPSRL